MQRRYPKGYPQKTRDKIRATKIIDRLQKFVEGEIQMTGVQVRAAHILLNKVLPDLKAVEHSGEVSSKPVEKMTNAELSGELARYRALLQSADGEQTEGTGAEERDRVH